MSDASATLAPAVTAATSLPIDYDKRLMLFTGRANPELGAKIAAHSFGVVEEVLGESLVAGTRLRINSD